VIDKCAAAGTAVPNNNSNDALHADHVFPLRVSQLDSTVSVTDWASQLARSSIVVCVTAEENYRLGDGEGWEKYAAAGITWTTTPEPVARSGSGP
jgi:hypothetical protein